MFNKAMQINLGNIYIILLFTMGTYSQCLHACSFVANKCIGLDIESKHVLYSKAYFWRNNLDHCLEIMKMVLNDIKFIVKYPAQKY